MSAQVPPNAFPTPDDKSVELSSRRTGMSFQRTRMSADRTLMSVIRTSLSLISFGFTIYQVFEKLRTSHVIESGEAPRNFCTSSRHARRRRDPSSREVRCVRSGA